MLDLLLTDGGGTATTLSRQLPGIEMADFTTALVVKRTPQEAFEAITNVRAWWSQEIDGVTDQVGGEFGYHYRDVHRCTIRVTELAPGRKVAWLVLDNYFNFIEDQAEWKDTRIVLRSLK